MSEPTEQPNAQKSIYNESWRKLTLRQMLHRFQIPICVVFGLIGFVYAVTVLQSGHKNMPYGEVTIYNKVAILDTMLDRRASHLKDSVIRLDAAFKNVATTLQTTDRPEYLKQRKILESVIRNTTNERFDLDHGKLDTAVTLYNLHLFPDKKNYLGVVRSTNWSTQPNWEACVGGYFTDTCKYLRPAELSKATNFELVMNKRKTLMSFISDYPLFGLWVVVTIAQMMLWFLLFPLLTGNVLVLQSRFTDDYQVTIPGILTNLIVPLLFMLVFVGIFYQFLADELIIQDEYFLSGFNARMLWYAVPGYLIATYGFATYISIARQVDMIDKKPQEDTLTANTDANSLYLSLKKSFDNAFLASAIILSLFVIWSSINITALNNLETIRFYRGLTGKAMIPGDFVYLMGLLHTCILLVFYLPVKLKFNSLDMVKTAGAPDPNSSALKTVFSTLSDNLSTLLVATSPLIASFIHTIFGLIQK